MGIAPRFSDPHSKITDDYYENEWEMGIDVLKHIWWRYGN